MRFFVTIALLFIFQSVSACDEPKSKTDSDVMSRLVMNRITPETFKIDQEIKRQYGCKYIIGDVLDSADLERAQPIAGGLPDAPVGPDGGLVSGKVILGYIIGVDGLAHDPVIVVSDSPILTETALAAMKEWRFLPGKYNGRVVATLAVQDFIFEPPH